MGGKAGRSTKPSASAAGMVWKLPNADRHCCIDLSLLRGLRPVREARGIGARTPASRRAGKNRAGRRYGARQIRMQ
jgi:hypothetical protein